MYVLLYSLDNIAYGESVRYGFCRRFAVRLFTLAVCRKVQFYQRADPFLTFRIAGGQLFEHRGVAKFRQRLSGLNPFPLSGCFTADRHTHRQSHVLEADARGLR